MYIIICCVQTIWIHQLHRTPSTIRIRRNVRVLVRHRVDTQEQPRQVAVVVPCSEVGEARLAVPFLAGESEGVKPHFLSAVYPFGFMCWEVQLVVFFCQSSVVTGTSFFVPSFYHVFYLLSIV